MQRGWIWLIFVVASLVVLKLHVPETYAETAQVSVSVIAPECSDGVDNDGDGEIDYPEDDGCESSVDYDETDNLSPECSDSVDNDGDGNIDFPDDLGCDSDSDDSEAGEVTPETVAQIVGTPLPVSSDRSETEVRFQGYAYPRSPVTISINGVKANTTRANEDGEFRIKINNLGDALYNFSVVTQDPELRFSNPVNYSLRVPIKKLTELRDIYLPPTVGLSNRYVLPGEVVRVSGYSKPSSTVTVSPPLTEDVDLYSNINGEFSFTFDTKELSVGDYSFIGYILNAFSQKVFSDRVSLSIVKDKSDIEEVKYCIPKGDINGDCKVNIIDFSIVAFWWEKKLSEEFLAKESSELNNDGVVDIVDFSIMAYYWTG